MASRAWCPTPRNASVPLRHWSKRGRGSTTSRLDLAARERLGAEWLDWLDGYLVAVRNAESELETLNARVGVATEGLTREVYEALPADDRREVLGGFLDCVFVRRSKGRGRNVDPIDERTRVLWRGQAPDDLPRKRVVNDVRSFDFDEYDAVAGMAPAQNGG